MTSPHHANHRFAPQQLHLDSAYRASAARSRGRPYVVHQDRRKTGRLAATSLAVSVLGAVSLYGAILLGPIGAVLGHVCLRRNRHHPWARWDGRAHGDRGIALAGVVIGWITGVSALVHGWHSGELLGLLARAGSLVS